MSDVDTLREVAAAMRREWSQDWLSNLEETVYHLAVADLIAQVAMDDPYLTAQVKTAARALAHAYQRVGHLL